MNDMILQCTGSRLLALYAVGQKQICDLNNFLESQKQQIYDMGFYFRSDIGSGWLFGMNDSSETNETNDSKISLYSKAGVNIETKNKAIKSIHSYAKETHHEYVIDNEGGFGGLIRLPCLPRANFQNTKNDSWVIVNSTDSVGSKSLFVRKWWGLEKGMKSLGHDIVNHCVNDILVQSPYVRPWTFMDYYATHHLDPRELRAFVEGVSEACKKVQCALIGGETAEIPGLYREGASDLVGAITGIVYESQLLRPRETICEGDLVFGLPSESPHTNGYTLIQKLIKDAENDIQTNDKKEVENRERNKSMYLRYVDEWCKPHKCYMEEVKMLVENGIEIKGLCHITGGGFKDNPPRIIDTERYEFKFDYDVIVNEMPPWMKYLYDAVLEAGSTANEVFQTFNCGYGMLVVVDVKYRDKLSKIFCEKKQGKFIGEIVAKSSEDDLFDL